MTETSRAQVASSFTIIKGALIEECYSYLSSWDAHVSRANNLRAWTARNPNGLPTQTWIRDVAKVLNRRLDPCGRDAPLLTLAKGGCNLEEWKPLLLWHMTRDEFLVRDFLVTWLFEKFEAGAFRIRSEDVEEFLASIGQRGATTEHAWSESTTKRVAAGLLKIAVDFGFLRGSLAKEFASFHLPERSFLYLVHAMRDAKLNPGKLVTCPEWRLFMMRPADVEHELLRLHQYRKLDYQVAGSLAQLTLPCSTAAEYARSMVA